MCRSQQKNEVNEDTTSSDNEGNLIQSFHSCNNFEIMSIECNFTSFAQTEKFVENRIEIKHVTPSDLEENENIKKISIHSKQNCSQGAGQN